MQKRKYRSMKNMKESAWVQDKAENHPHAVKSVGTRSRTVGMYGSGRKPGATPAGTFSEEPPQAGHAPAVRESDNQGGRPVSRPDGGRVAQGGCPYLPTDPPRPHPYGSGEESGPPPAAPLKDSNKKRKDDKKLPVSCKKVQNEKSPSLEYGKRLTILFSPLPCKIV